jgi:hypothetical protein
VEKEIAWIIKKLYWHQMGNDFSNWRPQSDQARVDVLEEVRREYHTLANLCPKDAIDVQPRHQSILRRMNT